MIDYEIHSGCGARKNIKASSLRGAKAQATRLGFGSRFSVWIRDNNGKVLTRKWCDHDGKWTI